MNGKAERSMNIFVATGTQKFPFDRMLKKLDEAAENHPDWDIFAQSGTCAYKPEHYASEAFIDKESFDRRIREADLIVTHGGAGVIVTSLRLKKRVVAVPRLREYGEHVDDHQKQIITAFETGEYLLGCWEMDELDRCMEKALSMQPKDFVSNTDHFIAALEGVITAWEQTD